MKLVIDFEKLAYRKPRGSFQIFANFFWYPLLNIGGLTPTVPPFTYRRTGAKGYKKISYSELGQTIRFDDELANQALMKHQVRLDAYKALSSTLYWLFILLIFIALMYIIVFLQQLFNPNLASDVLSQTIIVVISSFIIPLFALRISVILVERNFVDTLSLISGIYLLITLEKETNLADPEARRRILGRIRVLRRNMALFSLTSSGKNGIWVDIHFKQLENFVREREYWLLAPQAQTLDDLRRDFGKFVEMLVMGQYGDFAWDAAQIPQIIAPVERKPAEKVIRFLAGGLPFVLLLILFLFPAQISAMGFDHNMVTLFLLAWLLLAIDSGLNLGLVERAGGLAKTFKDLR